MPWKRLPSKAQNEVRKMRRRAQIRMLIAGLVCGLVAAALVGLLIYKFGGRGH